jgi:uncharacterized protein with von Willebrand factor type A (vWA) domain
MRALPPLRLELEGMPMPVEERRAPVRLEANLVAAEADGGRIAENILGFARLLRAAGLPVGPEKTVLATRAVLAAGIESPWTLYWTLHAVFVNRRSEREIFSQAFLMFWKDPGLLEHMRSLMLPTFKAERKAGDKALSRRLTEVLFNSARDEAPKSEAQLEIDAAGTFSDNEQLAQKDFEQMSASELSSVRRAITRLRLAFPEIRTRRYRPDPAAASGRLDARRILRDHAAKGGDGTIISYRRQRWRRPPLVVLCDISGSMDAYARVFLHFLYALTNDQDRVSAFLFGTRLSHVTRALKHRDPDAALSDVARTVTDWSGGTRIGACLKDFNRHWARRVLGQNATVLLFTDGLDRDGGEGIDREIRRLKASARRLVWLNPLLRYDCYKPIAQGAQALARHITEIRACHNLRSLADLVSALAR